MEKIYGKFSDILDIILTLKHSNLLDVMNLNNISNLKNNLQLQKCFECRANSNQIANKTPLFFYSYFKISCYETNFAWKNKDQLELSMKTFIHWIKLIALGECGSDPPKEKGVIMTITPKVTFHLTREITYVCNKKLDEYD